MTGVSSSTNPVPNFYRASAEDFRKIPGSPIAYWVSERVREIFNEGTNIGKVSRPRHGMSTGNNNLYLRRWNEVNIGDTGFNIDSRQNSKESGKKWFPVTKGGEFKKWYGNNDYVINYWRNGHDMIQANIDGLNPGFRHDNTGFYFKPGITWSTISSSSLSMRYIDVGFIIESKGSACYCNDYNTLIEMLGYANSKLVNHFLLTLSPTLDYHEGPLGRVPVILQTNYRIIEIIHKCLLSARIDWNSYETSWDFTTLLLLRPDYRGRNLKETYTTLRSHWQETTLEMQQLEEENNRIFIEAYGLEDELTPDVPLSEITLTCNPYYRHKGDKTEKELEELLQRDTIKELISYSVGCMFGRYSLDKPGLILANQGDKLKDFLEQVPEPSFMPDDDNIIPILDDEYFTDDIVSRFKDFLKITFGRETLSQNLDFIAKVLSGKSTGSPEKIIRDYFIRDFYKDHVQTYKKRPIYWMFSSGKNQGFNALIYMHRYDRSTLAKMRTDYLLELESKLDAEIGMISGDDAKNKTKITKVRNQIEEIQKYDELLNNKALSMIEIDLDDGVVVNYAKFEGLVKEI